MLDLHPKYLVDERSKRIVILTEEEYENLVAWAQRRARLVQATPFKKGVSEQSEFRELRESHE